MNKPTEFPSTLVINGRDRLVERALQRDGSALVVWPLPADADGGGWLGLDAQRLAADGTPLGTVQPVVRAALPAQLQLQAVALDGGGFAIAWAQTDAGTALEASVQWLDADAVPVGAAVTLAGGEAPVAFALRADAAGAQLQWLDAQAAPVGAAAPVPAPLPAESDAMVAPSVLRADAPEAVTQALPGLLSAGPAETPLSAAEEQVNTYTTNDQSEPEVAALVGGRYVITWESTGQDGSGVGIYAQMFEANGRAVGPEWRVNSQTVNEQGQPRIAGLSDGGFVIVWQDNNATDGSSWGVLAQRYDAAGQAQGGNVVVNTTTASGQYHPMVASYGGGFAVTWSSEAGGSDIYLKTYTNAGAVVLPETRLSTMPGQPATPQPGTQYFPHVAADASGNLVVVWHDQSGNDGSGYGVYGRTISSAGVLGNTFLVNTTTSGGQSYPSDGYAPRVAMLTGGGFVVVWPSDSNDGSGWGIMGQRFDAAGAKVGGEFLVNNSTSSSQYMPTVIGQSTGGFTVAWFNDGSSTGTSNDVFIREYDAAGNAIGAERKLASLTNSTERQPAIADLGDGNFVVVYADYVSAANGGNETYEIVQQLFGSGPALARSGTPTLGDFTGTVTFGENAVNAAPQVIDAAVSLTHTGSPSFDGGRLDLFYVQGGEATDQLGVRHQGSGFGQIGVAGGTVSFGGTAIGTLSGGSNGANLVISFNANATVDAVEALVQNLTYASSSQSPAISRTVGLRISDGDGGATEPGTVVINVTGETDGRPQALAETPVNTHTPSTQDEPEIAVLADGSYVIVWQSYDQDAPNTNGVYFQRFAPNGTPIGPELRANSVTASAQELPRAAALSDGGFVLVWQDNAGVDGSGWGIVAQRYDAQGVAQGGNVVVNSFTSSTQAHAVVAGYTGGYAVAWTSQSNPGGNSYDIYLKRYDNAGTVTLAETRVSTVPGQAGTAQAGAQYYPDIAAHANGNLVIVWSDDGGNDGSARGVYGRLWNAGSQSFSDTFLVNTTTSGSQSYPNTDHLPRVATLADGGFVVVWSSDGNDASGWAVMGQRFNAAGAKVGGEFQVNQTITGSQYQPDVTGLSTGGFVVTFYNDNVDVNDSSTQNDVYIREYDAAGNPVDGQRKLASPSNGTEYQPVVADLGNGNFVVAYADYNTTANGGNNTYGIAQQIFGSGPSLARQAAPTVGDFAGTVTFAENLVNGGLQVIDAAVSVSDADSANFAGGRLDLYYVVGGEATDQLGVRHQGNGAGQIGVAGNTVSFGGTAIGTLSGGTGGANLVISFNANATVDAVEALVQNLGYGSSSQSPAASRTVGLRLSDGDGGASSASTVTIIVTPGVDGAAVSHGPEQVNTRTANTQDQPEIAVLGDGSYVVVWESYDQDSTNTNGVYFQRFAPNGTPIGPEVRANTVTASNQQLPRAAALGDGGFVIAWEDNSGFDGSGWGIVAQRYNAQGVAQGANFVVNSTTSSTQDSVALAGYGGGFAAVWSSTGNAGGSGYDIYLRRFDNAGNPVQAETRISTVPGQPGTAQGGTQSAPDVAADAAGNLVVVWTDQNGNDGASYGVFGRTISAAGVLGNTFLVNTNTASNQYEPRVAMLAGGGFVVVWRDDSGVNDSGNGVFGQRFDAAGNKLGGEFLVNQTSAGGQYQPAVTALSTGGFVVAFYNDNYDVNDTSTSNDVYIREYDAAGNPVDGQRKLVSPSDSTEYQPAIADLGNGSFVVAYADYNTSANGGNNTYEIAQQIFGSSASLARQASPVLGDFTGTVTFGENAVNAALQVIDASVSLSDVDSANFAGGRLDLYYVAGGEATDQLGVRHQGNGAGQIGVAGNTVSFGGTAIGTLSGGTGGANLVISFNANATVDAVEALVQNLAYASGSQSPAPSRTVALRISDGDGGATAASTVTIQVTGEVDGAPLAHGEERVSSYAPDTQDQPEIAVLADGSYVITWESSGQDGSGQGVYFQRFAANGVALGGEVRAASTTVGAQQLPRAAALSDGGFVIAWEDGNGFDGSGWGIVAQRYNAQGVAQGANFVVNTTTSSTQDSVALAGYGGGFAAVWSSTGNAGGSGYDIYLRRFDNAGNPVQAETRLSTVPGQAGTAQSGTQTEPDVAADAAGNLVVVWTDQGGNDGASYGVYGRTISAAGVLGNPFLVNTNTASTQYEPRVAMLAGGGFVVVWRDGSGVNDSASGVFGQRFDAAGNKLGGEFLVNQTSEGSQYMPAVTALSTGGFVVSFYNDNYDVNDTSTTNDVYIREYDAAGNAVDGQRKLASPSDSTEYQPAIADLGNGSFVVAYADYNTSASGGNNTYGIAQQIFGSSASLARGANPVIGDLTVTRLLSSAAASPLYAGNAQLVDGDVAVQDADSANFDGGQLTVSLANGATPTETLAVRHQGAGAGQIGVSGATVSFGGTAIGTLSGGGAGASSLVISLNASADAAAVRALIENITYQNSVPPAGTTDRSVAFRLSDGDGGTSAPVDVVLRIQATVNPQAVALDDVRPSITIGEAQAQAGVLVDDAVQLVYSGATGFNNGKLSVTYVSSSGRPVDQLAITHEGNGAGQVGVAGSTISVGGTAIGTVSATLNGVNGSALEITFNASATDEAIEQVIEALRYSNSSAGPLPSRTLRLSVSDGAGTTSTARDVVIGITAATDPAAAVSLTGDLQANSFEAGGQQDSSVGRLLGANNGGYVIAWRSDGAQDGSSGSVQAQRFDANGQAVGAEISVNSYTQGDQSEPSVDGLGNGGFVIAWTSSGQDGSSDGVYAQRFDANGQAVGAEFRVNTTTIGQQDQASVLGLADGGFLIAYSSDYTNGNSLTYDVLARRYDANGVAVGGEITLNTNLNATQDQPALARLAGGGFVATWQDSSGADGNGYGVIAQRYAADGSKLGGEIVVNTTVTGTQESPDVSGLANGGFVVAWHSSNVTYAQVFTAAGVKVGAEIVVSNSDAPANYSTYARVAALDSGGFVVSWDSNGTSALGGSGYDIVAQQFDGAGNRIDGPVLVNRVLGNTQIEPDLVGLTGSNYVVSWSGYDAERGTQNTYGIFHTLRGTPGSLATSAPPVLVDVASAVSLGENAANAAPQLLDTSVGLSDLDSANLDGGRLWVSVISSYPDNNQVQAGIDPRVQDQLSVLHQGNGAGQVGVAGNVVSFGGVAIGSIVLPGTNGGDLVLQFNASATTTAVEAVIERLAYANTSSDPGPVRTISISISDGDGATSAPRLVTVNLTPEADGPQPLFGNERVNTYSPNTQDEPAVAALADGGYVIVWASEGQDGNSTGVFGQRYSAIGERIGTEFEVNTQTLNTQASPSVTALAGGGFVVTWQSQAQDGSGWGVYAQRFGADGAPAGSEFRVNTTTGQGQYQPVVSATADGGFTVAWYYDYYNASFTELGDVFFQRYDANGVALGAETRGNPAGQGTAYQYEPAIAGLAGGGFVLLWRDDGGDGAGNGSAVRGQLFNASGVAQGSAFQVNTFAPGGQTQPAVAALSGGGFVASWTSDSQDGNSNGVFAQRFDAVGNKLGGEFRVNTDNQGNQSGSAVTALAGGGFAIAYYDDGFTVVQQFAADGSRIDGNTRVDTRDNNGNSTTPALAGLQGGGFVVAFQDYDYSQSNYEIYQQVFGNPAQLQRQAAPVLSDVTSLVGFDENVVNALPQLIDASVDLSDADSANFDGGKLWVGVISGYGDISQAQLPEALRAQDQFGIRHEGDGPSQVGVTGASLRYGGVLIGSISGGVNGADLVVTFNASATEAAVEAVIENLTYANTSSAPTGTRLVSISVSDGDGGTSTPRVVQIDVRPQADGAQPLFGNEAVNTYAPGTQSQAAVTALADGGYVVSWTSPGQDGWGDGVHAQRYDARGVAVGSEFRVNSYTPNDQQQPSVTALTNGGWVIAWSSAGQDGSGWGIYAQRFDANGVPQGDEFRLNATAANGQQTVDLAALPGGGFVATWYSDFDDNNYYNVRAQRFGADGTRVGPEIHVDSNGVVNGNYQAEPAVASFADGSFVIVYRSDGFDGDGAGVYAQRYAANGSPAGSEFRVNTETDGHQYQPDVAALPGGGFVVVWRSDGQDGASGGIFGQRYAANGNPVGAEFRVNTDTAGDQTDPSVTALSNGGFAVSYYDGARISVQQFSADGQRLDNETRVDTLDNNANASGPALAGLGNGAFVVAWTDYDYDLGNYQIYQQLFADPAQVQRQANPELVDVATSVTFRENLVNAVPQLIDPGVGLFDADSANFDGGLLEVNYITGYGAQDQLGRAGLDNQDQLGIRHEGSGPGQVGVAGQAVSYGGVVIGTIVADGTNGGKLAVQFNAQATVDAVEQVIEALTYANTVSNPIASRTVSIRVTDGDGGASAARAVTINVTPETDGAVPFGLERTVNTTVAGNQVEPSISRLADGGYVVVWTDQGGADGSSYGVYGQRYDVNDAPVGGEFRVNTTTANVQDEARVQALAGGGFVVVWTSSGQDGSADGVYAQRYAANGQALSGELRLNTLTDGSQYQPTVAATADGGFIVAWYHESYSQGNTEYADILFQRVNANGALVGLETRANPPLGQTFLYQSQPSLAVLGDGSFVIAWTDGSQDGSGNGVYAQRFTATGTAQGPVLRVNSQTEGAQQEASVTALKDGGFLVTWQSQAQDLSGWGVYAQRYDAAGNTLGAEFRVNTTISSNQYEARVTALENGGWVVVWSSDQSGDVFLQQYNAAGAAVDGETRINSYTYSTQAAPAVTSMADGGFVVAWQSYRSSGDGDGDGQPDGGNDTYEIRLQRFSNTAPQVSDVVVNGQEDTPLVLLNTVFEAGFNDPDGQTLQAIKIITPPAEGTLRLNGVAVVVDQEISLADLQAGRLTYQGRADYFGLDQFRWTGSDGIAFASSPVFTNINLANVNDGPRMVDLTDAAGSEGSFFSQTITLNDPDPEGHRITVNWGDGSAVQVYNVGNQANHSIGHTYADNGSYQVTVTADDQQGRPESTQTDSFTVVVANVAPTLSLLGNANVVQNEPYTLTLGGVSDPGADTVTQYRIDWGDGSPEQVVNAGDLPANRQLQHTYASTGARNISVTLVDEDGSFASAGSRSVTVTPPAEVLTVDAGADRSVDEGTTFTQTISFTDPADQAPAGRSYTVDWGDGNTSSGFLNGGQLSFNISHAYADDGQTYNVVVTVDDSGAQQDSDSFSVTVANVAPTVALVGASSVAEGSAYTLTLNPNDPGSDTISQYAINWGDGTPVQLVAAADLPANRQVSHTYADGDASYNISVQVTDEDGVFANAGTRSVFVDNVGPTAAVSGAATAVEGALYTLNVGAVNDPGQDTRNLYSIDWGDGTPLELFTVAQWTAANGSFTHRFADGAGAGTNRTVTVRATDEDGSFVLGTQTVLVQNAAPDLQLGGAASSNEGATYTLAVSAGDAAGAADPLSYSIDWGDGSAVQVLTAAQLAALNGNVTHVFADDQDGPVNSTARTVSVTASDGDGGSTTRTQVVSVLNVAPTAPLGGADAVDEGGSYTLTVGAVADPGADARSGYSIDWGDGQSSSFTAAQWAAASGSFSHVYADGGAAPTIVVSATDEDGTFVLGSKAITVNNLAPTLSVSGAASSNEGATYTLAVSAGDAAGAADPLSYSIDWGDGSAVQVLTAAQLAALNGNVTHVFADDQDGPVNSTARTVSVTASDGDGGSTTRTQVVDVLNVAPTAQLGGADAVDEGGSYVLSVSAVNDPGTDTRSGYGIDWGDGQSSMFTPAQWAAANGNFSHQYADGAAARTITVFATDEDGVFELGSKAITVNNVAPTLSVSGAASSNEGATYTLAVSASDPADVADPLSYSIDWGDGSAVQVLTAAQLAALNGNVTHVFADDQDGAVNSTPRTVSVTVNDGDGGSTTRTQVVNVLNVAPTIALTGAATATVGQTYTLTLGAVSDPGQDTVQQYVVDWGDGNTSTVVAGGDVTHAYASAGARSIVVALIDEDGTHAAAATLAVQVGEPTATLSLEAGGDASLDEGQSLVRSINFSDGNDSGGDGWTYSIDYGDGTVVQGTTATQSLGLDHVYADGNAQYQVTVTLTDAVGETVSDGFTVTVANVAPTAQLGGADAVNEGGSYTLTVGAVADPGADTRSGYSIDWGDGQSSSFTAAQWAAANGSFSHVYADGGAAPTIVVSATDEDGTFVLGSKAITVNNLAPTLSVSGAASSNEGATYTLAVSAGDAAGAADPLSYSIDWGDGSAVQVLTAAQLAALNGNVTHVFADDQDGPVNSTARTVSVTVSDGDGGSTTRTQAVNVLNVAPTIALTGAGSAQVGAVYTLNLGAVSDPGQDTVQHYLVDWGDGTPVQMVATGGDVSHSYASSGSRIIGVTVVDEDGSFAAGSLAVDVQGAGNAAPVADDETFTMRPNQTLTIAAPGVLDGDTDADGDALQVVSINVDNLQGALTQRADGSFDFTPTVGFAGTTSFSYTVSDGRGGLDTALVTINVVNAAPVADDETFTMRPNQTLTIAAPGVLDGDTDADGDALQVVSINVDNLQGALTQRADGSFDFTPSSGFAGTTSFSYTVSDGFGGQDTAVVTINVVNTAPVADDETYTLQAGQTLNIAAPGVLDGDTDADGDPLQVLAVNADGLQGTLTQRTDGSFDFAPTNGFVGTTSFTYTVSDGFGGTDTALVSLVVLPQALATVRLGDAPLRQTGLGNQWQEAWTDPAVLSVVHKADAASATEPWTAVSFGGAFPNLLSGLDVFQGDLGVSGQALATSSVRQELDGTEALRINLVSEATAVELNLARFFVNDDGGLHAEAGLLRLIDGDGQVVAEQAFRASGAGGNQTVAASAAQGFVAVELWAGAYDGGEFVFGAYQAGDGSAVAPATGADGKLHGSDFALDWIEFDFPVAPLGIPGQHDPANP